MLDRQCFNAAGIRLPQQLLKKQNMRDMKLVARDKGIHSHGCRDLVDENLYSVVLAH